MVHKPVSPGPLRLMCLRMVSQAIYNYLECRPRLEKYLSLCGPLCLTQSNRLVNYVTNYFPETLKDTLLEFLTQLWFTKLLKMKQKTIDHERMSAGDPTHDHTTCGGTTSVSEAQRQSNLMTEILQVALSNKTKSLRFGFTNARSGPVDFSRSLELVRDKGEGLRMLDLSFATDTLMPSKQGMGPEAFNNVFFRECLLLCRKLAGYNNITSLKLLLCTKEMIKEIAKCSKLQVLEIVEASMMRDSDLVTLSQGAVRNSLTKLSVKFWSDGDHMKELCETQTPRKIAQGFSAGNESGRVSLPPWAVFLLNCRALTELQYFEPSQLRPFNPLVSMLTILREARKWWNLEIENEGDLLDIVIERPADLDSIKFKWTKINFEMGNDGLSGSPSETALNGQMEFLTSTVPDLEEITLTMFPTPMDFLSLRGLISTPAGRDLTSRLKNIKFQACHPSHLVRASELLEHSHNLTSFTLEHLQLHQAPHQHVVNVDVRDVLSWLPQSVSTLKVRGFHLLHRPGAPGGGEEGSGPKYPSVKSVEIVFCGSSDPNLLHISCLCPDLEKLTIVVSMIGSPTVAGPPGPPTQGMVASHLHSLCHNNSLVECVVLVKVGEGWIQIDDREMLGELVLGSSSDNLRKIVLFPIRGICGGGLRSLVRAAKERNICLNIGIGNQRPVKTETNRRTATDAFTLLGEDEEDGCQNMFSQFTSFLEKKVSEFEGQFWNDPDWFYGGVWPEQNVET